MQGWALVFGKPNLVRHGKDTGVGWEMDGQTAQIEKHYRAWLAAISVSEDIDRDHVLIGRSYGRNCAFLGWSREPYQVVITAIKGTGIKATEKTIGKILQDSVTSLFEQAVVREDADPEVEAHFDSILPVLDESLISGEVQRFLDVLKSHVRPHTVLIPMQGIELKTSKGLPIGECALYRCDHGPLIDTVERVSGDPKVRSRIEKQFAEVACYAVVEVEGESKFAAERAIQIASDASHVLNLYVASPRTRRHWYQKIGPKAQPEGVPGEFVLYFTSGASEPSDSPQAWGVNETRPGLRRYAIDAHDVEDWRAHGLDRVVKAFMSDAKPNSLESAVRRAATRYSKGVNADTVDDQFLAMAIALESLLVGEGDGGLDPQTSWGSIAQRLAEHMAFLLGTTFEERKYLVEAVRKLYKLRNKVAHGGQPVSVTNLDELVSITRAAILKLVCMFQTVDEVQQWESQQKFSVVSDTGAVDAK